MEDVQALREAADKVFADYLDTKARCEGEIKAAKAAWTLADHKAMIAEVKAAAQHDPS